MKTVNQTHRRRRTFSSTRSRVARLTSPPNHTSLPPPPLTTTSTLDRGLAVIAIIVSIISAGFTGLTYLQPGDIQPLQKPSGYSIIRGDESFPSDMLILPLKWENTSGRSILIDKPELILHEVDPGGRETGNNYRFLMAGEYTDISPEAFNKKYSYRNSFVVEGHSVPIKILVFHYERWYAVNDPHYGFRFKGGQKFKVFINYQPNQEKRREIELFNLPIFPSADKLQTSREQNWWDFWYLDTE